MERPGNLLSGLQRLKRATRDLQACWEETRETWDDQAARDFQQQHLEPILPALRLVMAATSELDDIFRRAIRDCDDDSPEQGQLGQRGLL